MPASLQPPAGSTDTTRMTLTLVHLAWLAFAGMALLLAQVCLSVLETRSRLAIERHNLVLRAREMRAEYWQAVAARAAEQAEEAEVVEEIDVVEEDVEVLAEIGQQTTDAAAEADTALRPAA